MREGGRECERDGRRRCSTVVCSRTLAYFFPFSWFRLSEHQ